MNSLATNLTFSFLAMTAAHAKDYYVSPSGNDLNSGSSSSPWQTIAKVNATNFLAGDRILFQGGQTFNGNLFFGTKDSGTAASPIQITSYGIPKATINANDNSPAIYLYDRGGYTLSNLIVVGPGRTTSTQTGIYFYNDVDGDVLLQHAYVDSVEVRGFQDGIYVGAYNGSSGWNDVRLTNLSVHDNANVGILTFAENVNVLTNVYVGSCAAYNNPGTPGKSGNSGNGIVLGNVNGATIENSVAYNNGYLCDYPYGGAAGIWTYSSNAVVIQHNESYNNGTNSAVDGDGFDLDVLVSNSVVQYNYSHGNAGAGYLLSDPENGNNIVRYNISENDGQKNNYGAVTLYGDCSASEIYNNTVYLAPPPNGSSPPLVLFLYTGGTGIHFHNNIFVATGGETLLNVSGASDVVFNGNDYFTSRGAFNVSWYGTTYTSFSTWKSSTGEEAMGFNVDPQLSNPGNGGTIGHKNALNTLKAYTLKFTSPLIDAGIALTAAPYNLNVGSQDFYGTTIPQGSGYDIGAYEVPVPVLNSAVSRFTVNTTNFDLPLNLTGTPSIESRAGSVSGNYKIVINFSAPVGAVNASLGPQAGRSGTVTANAGTPLITGSVVTVNLNGVKNVQRLNLHLSGIQPGNGAVDVPINFLWGDVNGDGSVNILDLGQVRLQSGAPVTSSNLRDDINADGAINILDLGQVRTQSGTSLP